MSRVIAFILILFHLVDLFAVYYSIFLGFICLLLFQVERKSLVLGIFRCYLVGLFDCVPVFPNKVVSGRWLLLIVDLNDGGKYEQDGVFEW